MSRQPEWFHAITEAVKDYSALLDKGYLTRRRSSLLVTGTGLMQKQDDPFSRCRDKDSAGRAHLRLQAAPRAEQLLAVDGYNVIFTLVNYRKGHPLFISTDGLLRDAGGARGRFSREADFDEALSMMHRFAVQKGLPVKAVYFDSPVSCSALHSKKTREVFASSGVDVQVELAQSADIPVRDWTGGSLQVLILCLS